MSNQTDMTNAFECFDCGSKDFRRVVRAEKFTYGQGKDAVELTADIPVLICQACGEEIIPSEAEELQNEAVCRHLGVMTPREIKALRQRRGWSQQDLADQTGCGVASVKRWEAGTLVQQRSIDSLMHSESEM